MSFIGKVVMITGAGSGIGLACARMVTRSEGIAVLLGRRAGLIHHIVEECSRAGGEALAVPTDVSEPDQVQRAVQVTLAHKGRIDAVVNCAGVARFATIEDARMDDLELMLDAHLRGPIHMIRATLPSLRKSQGCVVNVSSIGGLLAAPKRCFYGATKAALNHLTRSLARELAPEVRVNAILPGPVNTPIYDDLGLTELDRIALKASLLCETPAGRFAVPEEIARWIGYLLDDDNSWVTGALFCIDGGRSC